MTSHAIEVNLKPSSGGVNRTLPPNIQQLVQDEYAYRYLEKIGASATQENIDFIHNKLGIKDAVLLPIWAREKLLIVPAMKGRDITLQDMLSENSPMKSSGTGSKRIGKGRALYQNSSSTALDSHDDDESSASGQRFGDLFVDNTPAVMKAQQQKLAGRRLSWTTAATLDLATPLLEVADWDVAIADTFRLLLKPPAFEEEDFHASVQTFCLSLADYVPRIKQDKGYKLYPRIRGLLYSKQCLRLFGLLVHYCYWNVIHPAARQTIAQVKYTYHIHNCSDRAHSMPKFGAVDLFEDVNLTDQLEERAQGIGDDVEQLPDIVRTAATTATTSAGKSEQECQIETGERKSSRHSIDELFHEVEFRAGIQSGGNSPLERRQQHDRENRYRATRAKQQNEADKDDDGENENNDEEEIFEDAIDSLASSNEAESTSQFEDEVSEFSIQSSSQLSSIQGHGEFGEVVAPYNDEAQEHASELLDRPPSALAVDVNGNHLGHRALDSNRHVDFQILSRINSVDKNHDDGQQQGDEVASLVGSVTGGTLGSASSNVTAASLCAAEKEQLFMQLEACIVDIFAKVGSKHTDLITGRQALVSCCHYVVDDVLTAVYPWFSALPNDAKSSKSTKLAAAGQSNESYNKQGAIRALNLRLRRLVHQSMSDLIDPTRLNTSSILLSSLMGPLRIKDMRIKGKAKYYTTSVGTKALFGDTKSAETRRIFEQSSQRLYTAVPGVTEPFTSRSYGRVSASRKAQLAAKFNDSNNSSSCSLAPSETNTVYKALSAVLKTEGKAGAGVLFHPQHQDSPDKFPIPRSSMSVSKEWALAAEASKYKPGVTRHMNTSRNRHEAITRSGPSTGVGGAGAGQYNTMLSSHADASAIKKKIEQHAQPTAFAVGATNASVSISSSPGKLAFAAESPKKRMDIVEEAAARGLRGNMLSYDCRPFSRSQETPLPQQESSSTAQEKPRSSTRRRLSIDFTRLFSNQPSADFYPNGGVSRKDSSGLREMKSGSPFVMDGSIGEESPGYHYGKQEILPMLPKTPQQEPSLDSSTVLTDNRSLANNRGAEINLSLNGKALLMDLMVDKSKNTYGAQIQTNVVKSRVDMLISSKRSHLPKS